jgi:hypothetical protein
MKKSFLTVFAFVGMFSFVACSSGDAEMEEQFATEHAQLDADHQASEEAHQKWKSNTKRLWRHTMP